MVNLAPLDSCYNEQLRTWRNRPEIMRWCRQSDVISDVEQTAWFSRQSADPTIKMYAVMGQPGIVGVAGLTSIDRLARRAEFSLYIGPEHHGEGYGRKALVALFTKGFRDLGLNLIWGESFDGNPAIRLFESLGMIREGTRRDFYFKDGRFIDAHLFSIRSTEWKF